MVPELLDGTNHVPWFKAGELIFEKRGIQYLGVNGFINAHSILATLIVQARSFMPRAPVRRHLPTIHTLWTSQAVRIMQLHGPLPHRTVCCHNMLACSFISRLLSLLQSLSDKKLHCVPDGRLLSALVTSCTVSDDSLVSGQVVKQQEIRNNGSALDVPLRSLSCA